MSKTGILFKQFSKPIAKKHIPKNLEIGDKLILLDATPDGVTDYSRLTVKARRDKTTYQIEGHVIQINPKKGTVAKIPCNGVVYTDSNYLDVHVIRTVMKHEGCW